MSSLTEKVLMIGFGATICLSLFSLISPLLNNIEMNTNNLNKSGDVLKFYEMMTEIKRKGEDAIQFYGEVFRINYTFSSAKEIQFSLSNATTLNIEMERANQIFIDIIEFQRSITLWIEGIQQYTEFYHYMPWEEDGNSIKIRFDIKMVEDDLCFKFLL